MTRWEPERLDKRSYPEPGLDLPLLYSDLDTNHHLNNVALGRFFEHARVVGHERIRDTLDGGHFLVVRVAIDYLSEGRYGTPLHVRTRTVRVGTTSVTFEQAAWQDDRVVGLAEVVLALLRDGRPAPVPDATRALLTPTPDS